MAVLIVLMVIASTLAYPYSEESNEYEYPDVSFEDRRIHSKKTNMLARATTFNKPMIPLEFWEKVKKRPKGKHLKESRLLEKMGNDFDSTWMALERPHHKKHGIRLSLPEDQVAQLMEEVTNLNIETDIREMLGGDDHRHEPTVSKAVGAFQQWLVKKSSCPVQFEWEDLGEFFWPRYIRKGECHSSLTDENGIKDSSCSWPRGMSCNPADAEILQILRWHCRRRKTPDLLGLTTRQKIRKSYKCRWIKVPYPVTSSCKCD